MALTVPERDGAIEALRLLPLEQRLLSASEHFLGTPYVSSPLGEGKGPDPDPMIRFDAVDCLTFVEETIALGVAPKAAEVEPTLTRIRYGEEATYGDRNHLMEAQWLPRNLAKHFLVDVTRTYGGDATVTVSKTLTAKTWKSKSARALGLPKEHQPIGTFDLSIIPLEQVLEKAASVPSGTILVVVRDDLPGMVTRISHLGFLVHKGRHLFLRHASLGRQKVVDEPLESFVGRHARFDRWVVNGVALFQVRAPDAAPSP